MFVQVFVRRGRGRAVAGALAAVWLVIATTGVHGPTPVRGAGPVTVVMQQLDSCRHALPGGVFTLDQSGATPLFHLVVTGTGGKPTSVGGGGGPCPTPTGSCVTTTVGCFSFPGVPAPGTYTIKMAAAPPGTVSNPLGYAACTSGSACVSEVINVTVDFLGNITQAVSTNTPPTGVPHIFASHAATLLDPVLFYDFGLGFGSCDGDNDVDDNLTGTASSSCRFLPEGGEVTTAYPWASTLPPATGTVASVALTLAPSTLTADGVSAGAAVATVGVPDAVVSFSTQFGGDVTFVPSTAVADSSGIARTKMVAGHTVGTQTITATSGAFSGTAIVTLVTGSPYHPQTNPGRLLDTRCPFGGTHLGPGGTLDLDVTGHLLVAPCNSGALSGVPPAGATAVVLNVIAINPSAPTFITIYPTGSPRPLASSLNTAGGIVPNLVEVALGTANKVTFFNASGTVDLVADIEGYVGPGLGSAGLFVPKSPARICDTRGGQPANPCNAPPQPLGPGGIKTIKVKGNGGVPSTGVSAVVVNVTVTNTTAAGYLTVWPTGKPQPTASNLNFAAGQTVANRVVVAVDSTTGMISVFNAAGTADLVIDVNGYFTDSTVSTGSRFTSVSPARACDTRQSSTPNQCTGLTIGPAGTLTVSLAGVPAGVPSTATAVVLNLTVVQPSAPTYAQVYPGTDPAPSPPTSDVNASTGQILANMVVVKTGTDGTIKVFNAAGKTDVVIDVAGWYT